MSLAPRVHAASTRPAYATRCGPSVEAATRAVRPPSSWTLRPTRRRDAGPTPARWARPFALALLAPVLAPGLAAASQITIVTRGDAAGALRDALGAATLPVELRFAELPNAVPAEPPLADVDQRLAAAREAYVRAEFHRCLSLLEPEALVTDALGRGQRVTAARVLLWRVACHVGVGRNDAAARAAREMGALSLEMPEDAGAVTPEVESVVAQAIRDAGSASRVPLRIDAPVPAAVSLDGRRDVCSTPCTLEVTEGVHVVRIDSDGYEPDVRLVRLERPEATLTFRATPAPPALAAAQWAARYARSSEVDSAASMRLLSTALRAPRLLLVTADRESQEIRVRGVLAVDGEVAARSERVGPSEDAAEGLVRDLLVRGKIVEPPPPLYRRAGFWVALGVAAAAAAGTAAIANRRVVTGVEF